MLALSAAPVGLRGSAAVQGVADDGVRDFLNQLEDAVRSGLTSRYMILVADTADHLNARGFADAEIMPNATRVVIQERDRRGLIEPSAAAGYRLTVDAFLEFGGRAREVSWQLDIVRAVRDGPWRIDEQRRLSGVDNLYRLSLSPAKQFAARNLTIAAEDLEIRLGTGSAFVSETDLGVTGLVLIGDVDVRFHPAPETEQTQLKIYSGARTLDMHAGARVHPHEPRRFRHTRTERAADAVPRRPAPVQPRRRGLPR